MKKLLVLSFSLFLYSITNIYSFSNLAIPSEIDHVFLTETIARKKKIPLGLSLVLASAQFDPEAPVELLLRPMEILGKSL